ncbi:hypothetical protein CENSYa_0495 [Cenarchaeum symbiosum A]|uniref:Uncharacterized protein n=1 Tax=Cenarchaeum symbiosum (strain A) TaxID=414004 RepID=A0RUW1_CENSY|nr:hypothetical protein CENSYa_0495 [Cenarchaeum symbiosum A]
MDTAPDPAVINRLRCSLQFLRLSRHAPSRAACTGLRAGQGPLRPRPEPLQEPCQPYRYLRHGKPDGDVDECHGNDGSRLIANQRPCGSVKEQHRKGRGVEGIAEPVERRFRRKEQVPERGKRQVQQPCPVTPVKKARRGALHDVPASFPPASVVARHMQYVTGGVLYTLAAGRQGWYLTLAVPRPQSGRWNRRPRHLWPGAQSPDS